MTPMPLILSGRLHDCLGGVGPPVPAAPPAPAAPPILLDGASLGSCTGAPLGLGTDAAWNGELGCPGTLIERLFRAVVDSRP